MYLALLKTLKELQDPSKKREQEYQPKEESKKGEKILQTKQQLASKEEFEELLKIK